MVNINRIRFNKGGFELFLSPLESDVIGILFGKKEAKVREIHNILKRKKKVALTSVAVILDRLYKKDLVKRKVESGRGGIHYIYSTSESKTDIEKSIIESSINKLIDVFGSSAVNYFDERFSKRGDKK